MSKINKPKRNYLYSPYDMQIENADEDDMMDPVLSGLPSNLTRNLWDDWNEDSALQDDATLANFASGMDMTYVDDVDKQPPTSSDALLDSLMAEGNVKTETSGGFDDMMSPPTSVRNFTPHDVTDMMLPPSAFGYTTGGMQSKDTSDIVSTTQSQVRPRRASNPSQYAANSSTQYRPANGENLNGAPISPPRETMANMPSYTQPPTTSMGQASATPGFGHQPNLFAQHVGGYSAMQQGSFQTNVHQQHQQQLPTSTSNSSLNHVSAFNQGGSSSFGPSLHQQLHQQQQQHPQPGQHNGYATNANNGNQNSHGQFGVSTPQQQLPPAQSAPPPPLSSSLPSAGSSSNLANMGAGFHQPNAMFAPPSSFGTPSPYNNMMMPPSFMMYTQGPPQMQQQHQQFSTQSGNSAMMVNPFMNMPSMMGVNGLSNLPPTSLPFAMAMPPGMGPAPVSAAPLAAKPPLKPHVPLARKPGTGEISSMLQSLLDEEAEKRDKKLERNRDSARESRKKQQKYVEVLEDGIQNLQISKESLLRFRFGRSPMVPSQQLDMLCGLRPQLPSFAVVMNAARQKRMLGHPKHPLLDKVFTALARTVTLLQASLLDMHMLWDAASNGLADALRLSPAQLQQIQDMAHAARRREMTRIALLLKAFKVLRRQAFELGAFAPSLDVYFRAVLSPDQVAKLVTWTETNRSDLTRLQWATADMAQPKPLVAS